MSKINERIKSISEYFRGMEIKNGFYIVKVQYGHRWGAYGRDDESIKVAKSEEVPDEWFYYAETENVDFSDIFDLIEETIKMNKSALAKVELLKAKIEELRTLFEETPLEELQTLKFTLSKPQKATRRKYTRKKKEVPTEEKTSLPVEEMTETTNKLTKRVEAVVE